MSSEIDIQFVRDNYQRMKDEELIRVATQDAAGLTPEAQEIIKEEIEKRKLDTNIIKSQYQILVIHNCNLLIQ